MAFLKVFSQRTRDPTIFHLRKRGAKFYRNPQKTEKERAGKIILFDYLTCWLQQVLFRERSIIVLFWIGYLYIFKGRFITFIEMSPKLCRQFINQIYVFENVVAKV